MKWNPKPQPGPRVVGSGSVSRPITPGWNPKPQAAPAVVHDSEPKTS